MLCLPAQDPDLQAALLAGRRDLDDKAVERRFYERAAAAAAEAAEDHDLEQPRPWGAPRSSGMTLFRASDTSRDSQFESASSKCDLPPRGWFIGRFMAQGWVYWPNNGHCSPCHTK